MPHFRVMKARQTNSSGLNGPRLLKIAEIERIAQQNPAPDSRINHRVETRGSVSSIGLPRMMEAQSPNLHDRTRELVLALSILAKRSHHDLEVAGEHLSLTMGARSDTLAADEERSEASPMVPRVGSMEPLGTTKNFRGSTVRFLTDARGLHDSNGVPLFRLKCNFSTAFSRMESNRTNLEVDSVMRQWHSVLECRPGREMEKKISGKCRP